MKMKKLTPFLLALLFIWTLSSCGSGSKESDDAASADTETAAEPESTGDEWITLFDGETLDGWKRYGADEIGSLWKVSDEAASALLIGFYDALRVPGTSRAEALRRSQLQMLSQSRFRHPAYWSAFLLLNSWL